MRIALVAHHGSPLTQGNGPESVSPAAGIAAHAHPAARRW